MISRVWEEREGVQAIAYCARLEQVFTLQVGPPHLVHFYIFWQVYDLRQLIFLRLPLLVCCVFPWGILPLHSDWSPSCDHGPDDAS